MWLYLPTSACSPKSAASILECPSLFPVLAACSTSRGNSARPESLRRAWKTGAWSLLRFGPTCERLTDFSFAGEWMGSLAASPAPTSPSPESKPESKASTQGSGLNTSASFARFNPDGSLSKTSRQFSLFPQEQPYSEGLPRQGSMRSGYLYERPTWERRTGESGCSSWPTPTANDDNKTPEAHLAMKQRMGERDGSHANRTAITSLQVKVQVWPSPRSEDSECCGNHPGATDSLTGATKDWGTPRVGMERLQGATYDRGRHNIEEQAGAFHTRNWKTPHGMAGIDATGKRGGPGGEFAKQANQWTSPRASDPQTGHHYSEAMTGKSLSMDVNQGLWQTPATDSFRSRGGDRKDEMGLDQQARLAWATPRSSDWGRASNVRINDPTKRFQLQEQVEFPSSLPAPPTQPDGANSSPNAPGSRRRLNPAFAAMLMAWPFWWISPEPIASARSAMASWRSKARRHLSNCLAG
jgi:hypothetical protein